MQLKGAQRVAVAIAILAATGGLAWATMEAGRLRYGVLVVVAGFALRIVLARRQKE